MPGRQVSGKPTFILKEAFNKHDCAKSPRQLLEKGLQGPIPDVFSYDPVASPYIRHETSSELMSLFERGWYIIDNQELSPAMFASDTTHQQSVEKTGQGVEKIGSGMGRFFSTVRATVHNGNSTDSANAVSSLANTVILIRSTPCSAGRGHHVSGQYGEPQIAG
jgi:hypothetical protein